MRPGRILADFTIFAKGYLRSPVGLFFSLVFPLILIGMFGYIYDRAPSAVTLYTENLDHNSAASQAFLSALNKTGEVSVSLVDPGTVASSVGANGSFSEYLAKAGDTVGLIVPAGFESSYVNRTSVAVTVLVDPQDQLSSGIAEGAVNGVANGFNLQAVQGRPIITLTTANVGSQVLTGIDYLVPGLIGFTILTSPMFAMVDISSSYRKDRIFRQLSLTPLTKGEWLTSKILWYIAITFVTSIMMLAVGNLLFNTHVTFSAGVLPFLVLGPFFFVSLGMLAGSIAKTPESAAVIGNVITFPMMFLSGTFFPVADFSPPLKLIAHVLPLFYVIDGMNQTMLFENYGTTLWVDLAVVLVLSVVVFIFAILAFKWRDD